MAPQRLRSPCKHSTIPLSFQNYYPTQFQKSSLFHFFRHLLIIPTSHHQQELHILLGNRTLPDYSILEAVGTDIKVVNVSEPNLSIGEAEKANP